MNVEDQNGAVESNTANTTWYSAMWSLVSTGDGWDYIENRWQTSEWVHIENLAEYAQYSSPQTGWYSAMWQFVNPTTIQGTVVAVQREDAAPDDSPTITEGEPLVHSAVSPNGDGVNDVLTIDNIANYPDNKLAIMNANGVKVFASSGYDNVNKAFDGHSNITGARLPDGTYFYLLQYKANGTLKSKTGYLVLK